jgi:UDP-N-acetyl-D-glucosamine dehydrogenase
VADLAVVGLGYVGLPLAREAARAGLAVVGFDVNTAVVDALNGGRSHVDDVSDADVSTMLDTGFRATTGGSELSQADTVVICVPTPLSEDDGPDLRPVGAAAGELSRHLGRGMLVVLESTTYPGTTEEVLAPILEQSGLKAGVDFNLAFSPERIDPGNATFGVHNTPKVVGGYTAACTQRAAAFYGKVVETVVMARGTREAQTAKLLENTYRHVKIALVNELAGSICHDVARRRSPGRPSARPGRCHAHGRLDDPVAGSLSVRSRVDSSHSEACPRHSRRGDCIIQLEHL